MRLRLPFALLFLAYSTLSAQSGCTDPIAINYNNAAVINDGSCLYAFSTQSVQLKAVINASVNESSGLEWINGNLYSFNDSGGQPELYCVDTISGTVLHKIRVTNFSNVDWEDISDDSSNIYVGDFGNNNGNRTDLRILKIAKSQLNGQTAFTRSVTAQSIHFTYADQVSYASNSSNNYDCESLISVRDSLYIFTKDRGDNNTRVYKLPKTPGNYTVSPMQSYNVSGWITGADYNAFTNEVILIGYSSSKTYSFLYYLYNFPGVKFFSGNKRKVQVGNSLVWQTEGIAWYEETSPSRFFISCESAGNYSASVYATSNIGLTTGINQLAPIADDVRFEYSGNGRMSIISPLAVSEIKVFDLLGRNVNAQISEENEGRLIIDLPEHTNVSIIVLELEDGRTVSKKVLR